MAAIPPIIKGRPWALVLKVRKPDASYVNFATTPGYLYLTRANYRARLKYEPGEPDNEGAAETIDGISHLVFRLPSEWTREPANVPKGDALEVFLATDELTGNSGLGKRLGTVPVVVLADGGPVE